MSRGDYDDRNDRWDDRDDDRPRRGGTTDARKKVSTPGMLLIVFGGLALLIEIGLLALAFTNPNVMIDWYQKTLIDSQKDPNVKQQIQQDFDQQKEGMRLDNPFNIGSYVAGIVLNLLAVVGGVKMRSLSGYGLSMTGAIAAIIPISGCCCLTMPIGIWALVVLLNADVKRAFGRGTPVPRDDFDDRRRDDFDDRDR